MVVLIHNYQVAQAHTAEQDVGALHRHGVLSLQDINTEGMLLMWYRREWHSGAKQPFRQARP